MECFRKIRGCIFLGNGSAPPWRCKARGNESAPFLFGGYRIAGSSGRAPSWDDRAGASLWASAQFPWQRVGILSEFLGTKTLVSLGKRRGLLPRLPQIQEVGIQKKRKAASKQPSGILR